jgi:trimethylamine--corrinoid protein Co-methyltransferase
MRPTLRFLTDGLIKQIIAEAIDVLRKLGVTIHNPDVLSLLADHGAEVDRSTEHAKFPAGLIERALQSAPSSFRLYDVCGVQTHDFCGDAVYFTPGSTALNLLDSKAHKMRKPVTRDYVEYAKVVGQLPHIASQSTAMIPADVPAEIADSYRLFLSLLYCEKPVVTGAFTIPGFDVMQDLQVAVRGSAGALRDQPLTIFSCCPTSPLSWSRTTSQNLIDCARLGIPAELIAMPLSGFQAPVTLVGTLIQHTAETLSGVVISQLANPGAPLLYGGSPAIFDFRYETTPMGAIETAMIDCAYTEIGKHLRLPTQAYLALSDAKQLDAQAGLETGVGAVLAALSGINSISGPGMIDFESCLSLEKLALDDEICGMSLRLVAGIEPKEDFPAQPLLEELLREKHLLIADHTLRYGPTEITIPGPTIDRARRERWERDGSVSLMERAHRQIARLLETYQPSRLPEDTRRALVERMEHEARRCGMDRLPPQ